MSKLFRRIGTTSQKLVIDVDVHSVEIQFKKQCKFSVGFQRGPHKAFTTPVDADLSKREQKVQQRLSLEATLYQDEKKKTFQEKEAKLLLAYTSGDSTKVDGTAKFDIAFYANIQAKERNERIVLKSSIDPLAALFCTIRLHYKGEVKAEDQGNEDEEVSEVMDPKKPLTRSRSPQGEALILNHETEFPSGRRSRSTKNLMSEPHLGSFIESPMITSQKLEELNYPMTSPNTVSNFAEEEYKENGSDADAKFRYKKLEFDYKQLQSELVRAKKELGANKDIIDLLKQEKLEDSNTIAKAVGEKEAGRLKERTAMIEKELSEMILEMKAVIQDNEKLQRQLHEAVTAIENLKREKGKQVQSSSDGDNKGFQEKILSMQKELDTLKQSKSGKKAGDAAKKIEELEKASLGFQDRNKDLYLEIETKLRRIGELEQKLNAAEAEVSEVKQGKGRIEEIERKAKESEAALKTKIETLVKENTKLNESLNSFKGETERKIEDYENQLTRLALENDKLTKSINELTHAKNDLENEVGQLKREHDRKLEQTLSIVKKKEEELEHQTNASITLTNEFKTVQEEKRLIEDRMKDLE